MVAADSPQSIMIFIVADLCLSLQFALLTFPCHSLHSQPSIIVPIVARNQECQLQRLLLIEPRVAVTRVVETQILFSELHTSAYTLGDSFTCKFEMHTSEEGLVVLVDLKSRGKLREDAAKVAGFDPTRGATSVSIFMVSLLL